MDILEQIENKVKGAISTIDQLQKRVKELEEENQGLKDEQNQNQAKLTEMLGELERVEAEEEALALGSPLDEPLEPAVEFPPPAPYETSRGPIEEQHPTASAQEEEQIDPPASDEEMPPQSPSSGNSFERQF